MKRLMIVVAFAVAMAFIVRGPGQSLGEGIGQSIGNAGHFVSQVMTPQDRERR